MQIIKSEDEQETAFLTYHNVSIRFQGGMIHIIKPSLYYAPAEWRFPTDPRTQTPIPNVDEPHGNRRAEYRDAGGAVPLTRQSSDAEIRSNQTDFGIG